MRSLKTPFAVAVGLILLLGADASLAQNKKQPQQSDSQTQSDRDQVATADQKTQPKNTPVATASADAKSSEIPSQKTTPPEVTSPEVTSPETTSQKSDPPQSPPVKPSTPTTRPKLGRFALTFDDLKFDMEKTDTFDREMLTSEINSYHGGKVKIRGYIRPNFKQSGITKFIFVRDNKECCFGPQAAIFDNILVRLERGNSTNFTVRPVTVEGDFVLKEYYGDDDNVWSLYRMYNAKIK